MKKRRRKNSSLTSRDIKLLICASIVFCSVLLKTSNLGFLVEFRQSISTVINSGASAEEFVSAIGGIIKNSDDTDAISVFAQKALNISPEISEQEPTFYEDPTSDDTDIINLGDEESLPILNDNSFASLINNELTMGEYEPNLIIDMSEQQDGTINKAFEIPPPDNVSAVIHKSPFKTINPTSGTFTSPFGYRVHPISEKTTFHTGIDIANEKGTKIVSIADGKVSKVGKSKIFGNFLIIEHSNGYSSFYAHNSKILVKEGKKVKRGENISQMGTTGNSTGNHLHFEIRYAGKIIDPSNFVSY